MFVCSYCSIDATNTLKKGRHVNDRSSQINCEMRMIYGQYGRLHACLFSTKAIPPGTELAYDSGDANRSEEMCRVEVSDVSYLHVLFRIYSLFLDLLLGTYCKHLSLIPLLKWTWRHNSFLHARQHFNCIFGVTCRGVAIFIKIRERQGWIRATDRDPKWQLSTDPCLNGGIGFWLRGFEPPSTPT